MVIIGKMMVRGQGSTMNRKNVRHICGKPMIYWALKHARDAGFMDDIFVFTEDEEVAEITQSMGYTVVERPREMIFYYGGFSNPSEWGELLNKKVEEKLGGPADIVVGLNCNVCLLSGETLRQMYVKLMEDELAGVIHPVIEVEPHLYMENPVTRYLFPVWDDPGLDRQKYPKLFRKIGVPIAHLPRLKKGQSSRHLHHEVSFEESLDIHSEEDLFIAEAFLKRRIYLEDDNGNNP